MPCQPVIWARIPPPMGATTVAIPFIPPIMASIPASWCPEYSSVAMEREITTPPAPAMPCKNRDTTNSEMVCEKIHPSVESRNRIIAKSNGERRPYLSLRGPKINCPAAKPIILVVSPNCTMEDEVWKKSAIAGRVGKYISIIKGPKALNTPKNNNKNRLEFCLSVIAILFDQYSRKITSFVRNRT